MAVTKIHVIKLTLGKAIDYIVSTVLEKPMLSTSPCRVSGIDVAISANPNSLIYQYILINQAEHTVPDSHLYQQTCRKVQCNLCLNIFRKHSGQ